MVGFLIAGHILYCFVMVTENFICWEREISSNNKKKTKKKTKKKRTKKKKPRKKKEESVCEFVNVKYSQNQFLPVHKKILSPAPFLYINL